MLDATLQGRHGMGMQRRAFGGYAEKSKNDLKPKTYDLWKLKALDLFSQKERRLKGYMMAVLIYVQGCSKEKGIIEMMCHLHQGYSKNIRSKGDLGSFEGKKLPNWKDSKAWEAVAWIAVGSLPLKVLRMKLDQHLSGMAEAELILPWSRGLD